MNTEKFKDLITKYITYSINSEEIELLNLYLEDEANDRLFNEIIESNYLVDVTYKKFNSLKAKKDFIEYIRKQKTKQKSYNLYKYAGIAATVLLFISISFLLNRQNSIDNTPIIVNNNIKVGTNKAVLTLEDGSEIALEKGEEFTASNLTSNGEEVVYKASKLTKSEIAYNYLTIPRGGQYYVKLSDGTQVWLNSESKLKYPVAFQEGQPRQVELIYGEVYFDVSPSTNHNGSEFKVISKEQMVQVLGTEFNIKAYNDDDFIYTTLVEGSVSLNNSIEGTLLTPNQQAVLNKETKNIEVATVDAQKVTLWRNGIFSFRGTSLKEITKVLSRWYNVNFVIEDESLYDIRFKGVLAKDQNIKDILTTIANASELSGFEIKNKTITIK